MLLYYVSTVPLGCEQLLTLPIHRVSTHVRCHTSPVRLHVTSAPVACRLIHTPPGRSVVAHPTAATMKQTEIQ